MNNTDRALAVADQVLGLAVNMLVSLQLVSDMINRAKTENRDLSDAELDLLKQSRDTSLKQLQDALK